MKRNKKFSLAFALGMVLLIWRIPVFENCFHRMFKILEILNF